ncbi:thiol protease aleurain-like [Raphanus sativus]|uniref:fructose-bisphosphate aldolase n=1 Tax=Raphanus sativus TaxID=3726 RepID=A0A9W3D8I1_RAPSA|nr:thiol protease aleurain-like [Raphanus sativus]
MAVPKDWGDGIVSPVKEQGKCGSCWTFSTTGALEAAYHQAFGKGISLSEKQLVDCAGDFNNFGCNGGLPSQAFEYIKSNGGLDTEEAYPYTAKNGTCKYSAENVGVQVLDSVNITMGAEDELKHAIGLIGATSKHSIPGYLIPTCICLRKSDILYVGILLKQSMVTPGAESKDRATPEQVASYTLKLLRNRIPPAILGIMASSIGFQNEFLFFFNLMRKT